MKITEISTKNFRNESGIYSIHNKISKKSYIGQSTNVYKRLIHHKYELLNNKHPNSHLQRSFNKYGKEVFIFSILEYCNIDNLNEKEIYYINKEFKCYNIKGIETSSKGYKRKPVSEKTRKLLSDIKKGITPSNLKELHHLNKRVILYYINDILIKKFDSCKDASIFFNMKPNMFHQYIGKSRKTNKFPINYKIIYENKK
jgi:hypothetical protein